MRWNFAGFVPLVLLLLVAPGLIAEESNQTVGASDCSYQQNPDAFLSAQARAARETYERVLQFSASRTKLTNRAPAAVPAAEIPRRNFVDDFIFDRLEKMNVPSAPVTTDEEFVRRIYLDLIGRSPSPAQVREFLASTGENKRGELIDKLLASAEFNDKWSQWLGDLLGNQVSLSTGARQRQIEGRNAFYGYIREAIASGKPLRDIAFECITATGNNYEMGQANFMVGMSAAMGPAQDTYDLALYKTTSTFLGMSHYDCLLCHSGRGKLDQLSLWGSRVARSDAQRMAAFFSRVRLNGFPAQANQSPFFNSTIVVDNPTGAYDLNTTTGNRPNRVMIGTGTTAIRSFNPEYRDGTVPKDGNWRIELAHKIVDDPMFGRNFANRLWKEMFGQGLVDPVDSLDPDRLDPANPPQAPWALQASHPELLEGLAKALVQSNTNLRDFLKLLVSSSAYQLSSRYDGEWKYEYVNLFARHYARRLMAEEVHDVIQQTTGVLNRYTWALAQGQALPLNTPAPQSEPVNWAMQLPDPLEPRNNGGAANFLNNFLRGNRDTAKRSTAGSILQQMSLMNDTFVTNRIKLANSPVLRELAKITDNSALVEEVFLNFLARRPSELERSRAVAYLAKANNAAARNTSIEDLAWACINKVDFLFSY